MMKKFDHIDINLLTRYFSGESTPEEKEIVVKWKEASTENNKHFLELEKVWLAMDQTSPEHNMDIDLEWNRHIRNYNPSIEKPLKISFINTALRIAASILVILALSYTGWRFMSQKSIITGITETSQITLPDGSHVTLNADSKLIYPKNYGKKNREVNLQGEAYFEVKRNPQMPFIIKLEGAEVKVLGTSFNVKAYKSHSNIEVTVAEGKVCVYKKGLEQDRVIITKGEQVIYHKQSQILQKQNNANRNFISWKTLAMVFENDSLSNIVRTLNSVYHKDFIIQNAQLNNCTVTTRFENKDLTSVLKILQSTLDISFEEKDGKIVIKGKGC
jgi:transmembrane sensor